MYAELCKDSQDLAVRIRALLESNHPEGQQLNVDYALEDDFTCQAIVCVKVSRLLALSSSLS